jgi:trehalose synthase
MTRLEDYRHIIGDERVYKIYKNARKLYGKKIININSTYYGGGVAEIMNSLVLLMNDVGLDAGWWILRGNPHFFNITKKFHNMLQGEENGISDEEKLIYMRTNEDFARYTQYGEHGLRNHT